jgi:malate dehydrogenase
MEQDKSPLVVCITGAAGQIGYVLSQIVASGQVFGERKIALKLLDIEMCMPQLKGGVMELEDCAYPTLASVELGFDPMIIFKDMDVGIFVGGFPRKAGMERKELMAKNCNIFKVQGAALDKVAKKTAKILVVANPANTNCLMLSQYAPSIPKKNFSCLTRLDHNRALSQLAIKANTPVETVKNVIIWGNHSSTQYPDVSYATINGKKVSEVISDQKFLTQDLIATVQKRGAAIIEARKNSSVISAANAVKDHLKSWVLGTPEGTFVSMGVISQGNKYGIDENLCFSFPCTCKNFEYTIVDNLPFSEFSKEKIAATEKELKEERAEALSL